MNFQVTKVIENIMESTILLNKRNFNLRKIDCNCRNASIGISGKLILIQ